MRTFESASDTRYERNLTDVLSLQSEAARSVAREIKLQLTPQQRTSVARKRAVDPLSYEAFLKGIYFFHKGIPGVPKSIDFFSVQDHSL